MLFWILSYLKPMPQRYSGFRYGDAAHEDFEMWYHVCADAESEWENTPEGKASARARKVEERQKARAEKEAAKERARAVERQRKLDVATDKREKEEAKKANKEKMRWRRIVEQEEAARKVAGQLAAREKAGKEERRKKAAERAERENGIEEEERRRAREAREAVIRQDLAEEEQRRKIKEAEEAAALRQREEDANRRRVQSSDEQWARLQAAVQVEHDDLIRERKKLEDAQHAASARRWLEKRRQARLHPNNGSTEHRSQEDHAGHDAERKKLAEISLELADLELIVKAITNFRTSPPSPRAQSPVSFLPLFLLSPHLRSLLALTQTSTTLTS